MSVLSRRDGTLYMEGVALNAVAARVGTPCYCYSQKHLCDRFDAFKAAADGLKNATVCFAVKANASLAILTLLAARGAGADVVSGNELLLAKKAGIPSEKIVFSGVGKTPEELHLAVREGIRLVNLESEAEAALLNDVARSCGKKIDVGVRVNPDVDAHTHAKITTGKKENKFGLSPRRAMDLLCFLKTTEFLNPAGIDVHIGSQLLSADPFDAAFEKTARFVAEARARGVHIETIDVGGGLGVVYRDDDTPLPPAAYMETVRRHLAGLDCDFIFEPGRYLVAPAGVLVTKVIYVKETDEKKFAIVDAGMHTLIRPALYDAFHDIKAVVAGKNAPTERYDVVGPVCESSDVFGTNRLLPVLKQGDFLAIDTAGAYGETMSSHYNMHPFAAAVLIDGENSDVIRRPQTFDEMLADQKTAFWQNG